MDDRIMLKVERLTKTYPTAGGALTVLHEGSFEIQAGASVATRRPERQWQDHAAGPGRGT